MPLLNIAMLSSPEPICLENVAAGRTAVVPVVGFTVYGQEVLHT